MNNVDKENIITAGELREQGLIIPDNIPDCAWVPKDSLIISLGKTPIIKENRVMEISMDYVFTTSFKWVELDLVVKKE